MVYLGMKFLTVELVRDAQAFSMQTVANRLRHHLSELDLAAKLPTLLTAQFLRPFCAFFVF